MKDVNFDSESSKFYLLTLLIFVVILSSCKKDAQEVVDEPAPLPPGEIIHVPDDFPTIKMAADSAGINDTIYVTDGVYKEHDILLRAGITLIGSSNCNNVIIDAGGYGRCLRFTGSEYKSTISGITFQGGVMDTGEFPDDAGGGIYSEGEAPLTISNCKFIDNIADEGGGLCCGNENYFEADTIKMIDCIFDGNTADWGGNALIIKCPTRIQSCQFINTPDGGGLATDYVFSIEVHNCSFVNNENGGGRGAGARIKAFGESEVLFQDCLFDGNHYVGWGGGLYIEKGTPTLRDCIFRNNEGSQGGGIYSNPPLTIQNCIFENNKANVTGFNGGGAILTSSATVENCTFSGNSAESGEGSAIYLEGQNLTISNTIIANSEIGTSIKFLTQPELVSIECTDIWGNVDGDWVDEIQFLADQNGNFSLDPQFSNSQFNIEPTSPCAQGNNSCNVLIGAMPVQK